MRPIQIDNKTYIVEDHEFEPYTHPEYNNLKLYKNLADVDRIIDLLRDIRRTFYSDIPSIEISAPTLDDFGGYINSKLNDDLEDESKGEIYLTLDNLDDIDELSAMYEFILSPFPMRTSQYTSYSWSLNDYELYLNVHSKILSEFKRIFHWYIDTPGVLQFDNLVHLVMIVKNAGDEFADILRKNVPYIDRWTILDTGSTDNTVEIIKQVLGTEVRGELYQEPFIDFGTSRNRVLELAGDLCKYTLMLDDTYYVTGDLRGFLNEVRSDQFSDSFSLYITSHDVQYVSNRLLKTNRKLKYWFKIHEVVQSTDNINVIIPLNRAGIMDYQSDYMQTRTNNRKQLDLELLFSSIKEEPDNPRHYYYVAQTYVCIKDWENAYKYFIQRVYHPNDGFVQEKIDACFEAARTAQFQLNKPWEEVKLLYEKAHSLDPTRPDSTYFLAIKDFLDNKKYDAYKKFKKAFEIGYPVHAQYSLKPTLSFHYTPKFLSTLCYDMDDFETGEKACELYLKNNEYDVNIDSWHKIYQHLNKLPKQKNFKRPEKPYLCFIADGNWNRWTGRDINRKGLGGSETYIVEMARWIQLSGYFQVVVFCRCSVEEEFEGVMYQDIEKCYSFLSSNLVHTCIISRFSEYIPMTYKTNVENVFLVIHDIGPSGNIIPLYPKLKNIFLLTEWHKSYVDSKFNTLTDKTAHIHYGINANYIHPNPEWYPKDYHKYIFSSFANRGLKVVLEMWPEIRQLTQNKATLEIYSDVDHEWTNTNYPEEIKSIKTMLGQYHKMNDQNGIRYKGWVDKNTLAQAWIKADVWLYPCTFVETFCMTALEAAASRTLVITNDLGALQNTAKNGLIIPGDASTSDWKTKAISLIKALTPRRVQHSIDINYKWALDHSWKNQSDKLLEYILPHKYEYRDMYNWSHDLPVNMNTVQNFRKYIAQVSQRFEQPKVLEIGTWTGTSIIEILKLMPSTTIATTIDPWENYCEFKSRDLNIMDSYFKNIEQSGFANRIITYRSRSSSQLIRLVQDREFYHLIYVDGSHHMLDVYTDALLCWELLVPGGIMIIDDYLFEDIKADNLNTKPSIGVDYFIEQYKHQMTILHKDYRLFIQKRF